MFVQLTINLTLIPGFNAVCSKFLIVILNIALYLSYKHIVEVAFYCVCTLTCSISSNIRTWWAMCKMWFSSHLNLYIKWIWCLWPFYCSKNLKFNYCLNTLTKRDIIVCHQCKVYRLSSKILRITLFLHFVVNYSIELPFCYSYNDVWMRSYTRCNKVIFLIGKLEFSCGASEMNQPISPRGQSFELPLLLCSVNNSKDRYIQTWLSTMEPRTITKPITRNHYCFVIIA